VLAACHYPVLPGEDLTTERSPLTGVGAVEGTIGDITGADTEGTGLGAPTPRQVWDTTHE
jgi:hypothetical protein